MWSLRKLRNLMMSHFGPSVSVKSLLASPTGESADAESSKAYTVCSEHILAMVVLQPPLSLWCLPGKVIREVLTVDIDLCCSR